MPDSIGPDMLIAMCAVWEPDEVVHILDITHQISMKNGKDPADILLDAVKRALEEG